ncbi:flagellar biosynthesis regulator FlaF [Paragemmobacter ruber]|uniref:Flagellar biosynthesis regulator FlaF n=1 Tax=Paragemmobacter ruber TaxID=1985673 RepID=A0ABW9Y5M2_9RHOB|nr:flagellar biosynthesis regulator FlaF [Rhodobacter ruber]NBE07391.1 flagellar biosynthesis regulator FlaF [Rhodobacter ruber]
MTAQQLARSAYLRPDIALNNPRALEYDLLAQATAALRNAETGGKAGFSALASALNRNLLLWSALAADVAGSRNSLPTDLRARLFYLYQFTVQHSAAVLDGRADVSVLIGINTSVMRGLRGDAST